MYFLFHDIHSRDSIFLKNHDFDFCYDRRGMIFIFSICTKNISVFFFFYMIIMVYFCWFCYFIICIFNIFIILSIGLSFLIPLYVIFLIWSSIFDNTKSPLLLPGPNQCASYIYRLYFLYIYFFLFFKFINYLIPNIFK